MPRFFIPPESIYRDTFVLTGSEARHAALVLRKKVGDTIDLFDGKDLSYQGRIEAITPDRVEGTLVSQSAGRRPVALNLILYQALIKGPKWDWLVEKACEVGVATLVPVLTARSIVRPSRSDIHERWGRIALAASKQCGRPDVMDVSSILEFREAATAVVPDSLSLMPWEKETARAIQSACQGFSGKTLRLFIGPEGGWDAGEVDLATSRGILPVRLGPTLLRSETAGLVAAVLTLREFQVY